MVYFRVYHRFIFLIMNKISILLTSIALFLSGASKAQFGKRYSDTINVNLEVLISKNNQIVLPFSADDDAKFTKLNSNGEVIWTKTLNSPENHQFISFNRNGFHTTDTGEVISQSDSYENLTNRYSLNFMESNGDLRWSKYVRVDSNTSIALNQEYQTEIIKNKDRIIVAGRFFITDQNDEIYSLASFDEMGELKSHAEFRDLEIEYDIYTSVINDFFVMVLSPKNQDNESKIILLNDDLDIVDVYQSSFYIKNLKQVDDRIYALGADNFSPVLVSLNEKFEILYANKIISNFTVPSRIFSSIVDEGIIYKFPDDVFYSDVFSLLSFEGQVMNSWRIPVNFSTISSPMSASSDYILYIAYAASTLGQNGSVFVACHDPAFEEFGCYIPTTCLETEIFFPSITSIPNPFDRIDLEILVEDTNFSIIDSEIEQTDFCPDDFSSIAIPLFVADDTVCVNTDVQLYNIQNENASSVNWQIEGSTLQNTSSNDPGLFSYSEPGTYTITQEIVFAGCADSFSLDIEVISPVPNDLPSVVVTCEDETILNASTNGAIDFVWSNNSTDSVLLVSEAGVYTVDIIDAHCTQSHSFEFDFFDYNTINPLLGNDTIICEQTPLKLSTQIDASANFEWSDSFPFIDRTISQSGVYSLITRLGECSLTSTIVVEAEDCSAQLYLPNVFSPNQDGINDSFFPLGDFFEVLDFRIYDRWGSEVHSGNTAWKGNTKNKQSSMGVYHYVLRIRNTLLDAEELITGDVTLIR